MVAIMIKMKTYMYQSHGIQPQHGEASRRDHTRSVVTFSLSTIMQIKCALHRPSMGGPEKLRALKDM